MKIAHILLFVIAAWALAVITACQGGNTVEDTIRAAEMALARGDMTAARQAADHIVGERDLAELPAEILGRLSIVYMRLADSSDQNEAVTTATDCYHQAFANNADEAARYYGSLPAEDTQYAAMLSTLAGNREHPYDPTREGDEQADSLSIDSI